MHHQYTPDQIARFWAKVDQSSACWLWTGGCSQHYGYFPLTHRRTIQAHRFVYEIVVGPIPHGYCIDHLCMNRRCCNPQHLEAVTVAENNRRKHSPEHRDKTVPYIPPPKKDVLTRFHEKITVSANGCWVWQASLDQKGYALFSYQGKIRRASRVICALTFGDIPDDMVVDHICRNRACVNPDHLRLLTGRDNTLCGIGITAINARKTHCSRGHLLAGSNLHLYKDGRRECKQCQTLWRNNEKHRLAARRRSRLHWLINTKLLPSIAAANPDMFAA